VENTRKTESTVTTKLSKQLHEVKSSSCLVKLMSIWLWLCFLRLLGYTESSKMSWAQAAEFQWLMN